MIAPADFAQKQLEMTAEFGKFLFDHPEMDEACRTGLSSILKLPANPSSTSTAASSPNGNSASMALPSSSCAPKGSPRRRVHALLTR